MEPTTISIGDLVYYDSMRSGLVPVKYMGYDKGDVLLKVTANRNAYKRGEILREAPGHWVYPRKNVYVRNGKYCVRGTWRFEGMPEHFQPRWV